MDRIGFMQGRLSPLVDGRIQAFPWTCWQQEFASGASCGFHMLEWTLDQGRLTESPLLTTAGQQEIRQLCHQHQFQIPSLTGDCFMQAPFWKVQGAERESLQRDFLAIAEACAVVGISMIVVPLVDAGRLDNMEQEDLLVDFLQSRSGFLSERQIKVIFECDYLPQELARFIDRLDSRLFGVNYDIGNSAALGYDPVEEFAAYGRRIMNVHIKDRELGGTTVPLGTGNADFDAVFTALTSVGYRGNYILQTARAVDGRHAEVLSSYHDKVIEWVSHHGA